MLSHDPSFGKATWELEHLKNETHDIWSEITTVRKNGDQDW